MAAVQYGVLKTGDDVALSVGDRNAIDGMKFEEEVVSRVSALIWDTVVDDWAEDLVAFSSHAGRQVVNLDDVALLTRRNPELFKMACEMANVKSKGSETETSKTTTTATRGRKRKANTTNKPGPSVKDSRSNSPLLFMATTPLKEVKSPNSKQPKFHEAPKEDGEDPMKKLSFLKTPPVRHMTSTPKIAPAMANNAGNQGVKLFDKEFTPIRPSTSKEMTAHLSKVEEEVEEEEELDSFDRMFGDPMPTTSASSSKPNLSSLIRMAEEDPPPGEATVANRMDFERLNAMVPDEQEYDSFDDDIIVDTVIAPKSANVEGNNRTEKEKQTAIFNQSAIMGGYEKDDPPQNNSGESTTVRSPDVFAGETSGSSTTSMSTNVGEGAGVPVTPLSRGLGSGPGPSEGKRRSSVFSNKLSAFNFDDEDSFDAPVQGVVPLKPAATDFSGMMKDKGPEKTNKTIQLETLSDDSFDELPVGSVPVSAKKTEEVLPENKIVTETLSDDSFDAPIVQPKVSQKTVKSPEVVDIEDSFDIPIPRAAPKTDSQSSSQSIPKWKATADKWKKLKPGKPKTPRTATPEVATTSTSSGKKNKKQNKSLEYDSFDEFDFDI